MSGYKYTTNIKENMACAVGRSLPISTKQAVEVCSFIRGDTTEKAKKLLEKVIKKKQAVPYKRYKGDIGHKKKIGPGRYPVKASKEIIKIIESAEANARFKGLGQNLIIKSICAHKAARNWHFGRFRRRKTKRSHIEIVLKEKAENDRKKVR